MPAVPATEAERKTCRRHSRKPAVAICATCSSSICRECLVPTSVGIKCSACTAQRGPRGAQDGGRSRRLLPALGGLGALLAVVLLGVSLTRGGRSESATSSTAGAVVKSAPTERVIQFTGAGGMPLSGTLSLPAGAAPGAHLAAVVILAGFGPTDRNGVSPPGGVPDSLYSDLSDSLVSKGIVTLRYDKRGTGRSILPDSKPLRFDDLVSDAGAAFTFLAARADVDPARIAVVGHEEGGLVAMKLAAKEPRIRGLALISVPGRPLVNVLADDFTGSAHRADVPGLRSVVATLLATGALPKTIPPSLAGYFPTGNQKYLYDIFSVDPLALARQVKVPVLLVRGGAATLVTPIDITALGRAFPSAPGVFNAPQAGATLAIAAPTDTATANITQQHDAIGAAPNAERSTDALERIAVFVATSTKKA